MLVLQHDVFACQPDALVRAGLHIKGSEEGKWGKGVPLRYADYRLYIENIGRDKMKAAEAAQHFGEAHAGDLELIALVEAQIKDLEEYSSKETDPNDLELGMALYNEIAFRREMLNALTRKQKNSEVAAVKVDDQLKPWGSGKALKLVDVKRYVEIEDVNMLGAAGLTHAARHYGKVHQNDVRTIKATKDYRLLLLNQIKILNERVKSEGREHTQEELELEASLALDAHVQMEALEFMDYESALSSGKMEAIQSFNYPR